VEVVDNAHPLTSGIADFDVVDELYLSKTHAPIKVLMQTSFDGKADRFVQSDWDNAVVPILYLREIGAGSILYNTLGHCRGHYDLQELTPFYVHPERCAWDYPIYYDMLRRGLRWALREI